MSDLPEGWALHRIAEVVQVNPPKPPRDALPAQALVSFVPMPAVSAEKGAIDGATHRPFAEVRAGYTAFADGDVLLAKITPCFENGKAAVARELKNGLGFGSSEFFVLRSLGALTPEYLFHFVRQQRFRDEGIARMAGAVGQARVPPDFVRDAEIPVPPLAEQRRIVQTVEALLEHVNCAKTRLAGGAVSLQRLRLAVVAAACTGSLTSDWRDQWVTRAGVRSSDELPPGWNPVQVGDVIESLKYGTSQKCGFERAGGIPVLRIPNVARGVVDHSDLKYAALPKEEAKQLRLSPGDILIIRSNGSVSLVGQSAVVREPERGFAYAGYLIRLRPARTVITPDYLNLALGSFEVRLQIEFQARSTSGVHNINGDEIRSLQLALPPLAEQEEIARRVGAFVALSDQIDARLKTLRAIIEGLGSATLTKAFAGALVPTEAHLARTEGREYESAEQLLPRIQQREDTDAAATGSTRRRERTPATARRSTRSGPRPHRKKR